jgi:tetratricopeptide (TPR) repeat protein
VWSAAEVPHRDGRWAESEQLHKQVLAEFPDSQRAALRVAIAQERQGKADAFASYDRAIALDPQGQWAPVALFYKARACKEGSRAGDARAAIARLRAEHPDSSYVARAAVLEAELDGRSTAAAEAELARELAAAAVYDAGMAKSKERADEEALVALRRVSAEFPGTAAALRALDAEGHILTRNRRFEEALAPFMRVLEATKEAAPNARAVEIAATRVAALHHAMKDHDAALQSYLDIADNPAMTQGTRAHALLHGASIYFEILQRRSRLKQPVEEAQWDELRRMLVVAREAEGATDHHIKLARLMHLESWTWQKHHEPAPIELEAFLADYQGPEHRREVATARIFAGSSLNHLGRHAEALEHLQWVIDEYGPDERIWPGWHGIQMAYTEAFASKRGMGAPREELVELAAAIARNFPDFGPGRAIVESRVKWDSEYAAQLERERLARELKAEQERQWGRIP